MKCLIPLENVVQSTVRKQRWVFLSVDLGPSPTQMVPFLIESSLCQLPLLSQQAQLSGWSPSVTSLFPYLGIAWKQLAGSPWMSAHTMARHTEQTVCNDPVKSRDTGPASPWLGVLVRDSVAGIKHCDQKAS